MADIRANSDKSKHDKAVEVHHLFFSGCAEIDGIYENAVASSAILPFELCINTMQAMRDVRNKYYIKMYDIRDKVGCAAILILRTKDIFKLFGQF